MRAVEREINSTVDALIRTGSSLVGVGVGEGVRLTHNWISRYPVRIEKNNAQQAAEELWKALGTDNLDEIYPARRLVHQAHEAFADAVNVFETEIWSTDGGVIAGQIGLSLFGLFSQMKLSGWLRRQSEKQMNAGQESLGQILRIADWVSFAGYFAVEYLTVPIIKKIFQHLEAVSDAEIAVAVTGLAWAILPMAISRNREKRRDRRSRRD